MILHARHVVIILDGLVLQVDYLAVRRDEAGDDEELPEVDVKDQLTDLLTMLQHDQFVLPIRDYKLEVACQGGHELVWVQLWHLLLVDQVVEEQIVSLVGGAGGRG